MKHPFVILLLLSIMACTKKDNLPGPSYPTDSLSHINRWILDSMRAFYYWNDEMPVDPDYKVAPQLFFNSLLSSSDRFSKIFDTKEVLSGGSAYTTYGFHYALVQVDGYAGYVGVITYVSKFSASGEAGWKRGDYFVSVNGTTINAQNMAEINTMLNTSVSVRIQTAAIVNDVVTPGAEIMLSFSGFGENPVQYTGKFTEGGKVTGYLFYNGFNESNDGELLVAFGKLRQENISELILDLRYNPGGSVASSAKMAAMITAGLKENDIYAVYEGNKYLGRRGRTLKEVLQTSWNDRGREYNELKNNQLGLQRVFVLTTKATASAAELLINSLKPYISVIQIGETTTGKDEASFTIRDQNNEAGISWELQPIVYKLFNKNNEGGYHSGLIPQYAVNELETLPLSAIGSSNEPLTRKALQLIYGNNIPGTADPLRIANTVLANTVYSSAVTQANNSILEVVH